MTITEKVNQISQYAGPPDSTIFSPEVGTLLWSTVVENLSELEANDAKLMADSGYLDLVSQATKYQAPGGILDDSLVLFVLAYGWNLACRGTPPSCQPPWHLGSVGFGHRVCVEIVEQSEGHRRVALFVLTGATGTYGSVGWITSADSIDDLQASSEKVNSNAASSSCSTPRAARRTCLAPSRRSSSARSSDRAASLSPKGRAGNSRPFVRSLMWRVRAITEIPGRVVYSSVAGWKSRLRAGGGEPVTFGLTPLWQTERPPSGSGDIARSR